MRGNGKQLFRTRVKATPHELPSNEECARVIAADPVRYPGIMQTWAQMVLSWPNGVNNRQLKANGFSEPDEPKMGDLWPGETEADFGYPVSADGTREVEA